MTEQPQLCAACYAEVLALASTDPRPNLIRWCKHNRVQAFAFKRGTQSIQSWELYGPLTDRELVHGFSDRLAEMFADGQVATQCTR